MYANAIVTNINYGSGGQVPGPLSVTWAAVYGDNVSVHGTPGASVALPIGTSAENIKVAVQTAVAMAIVAAGYAIIPDDVVVWGY